MCTTNDDCQNAGVCEGDTCNCDYTGFYGDTCEISWCDADLCVSADDIASSANQLCLSCAVLGDVDCGIKYYQCDCSDVYRQHVEFQIDEALITIDEIYNCEQKWCDEPSLIEEGSTSVCANGVGCSNLGFCDCGSTYSGEYCEVGEQKVIVGTDTVGEDQSSGGLTDLIVENLLYVAIGGGLLALLILLYCKMTTSGTEERTTNVIRNITDGGDQEEDPYTPVGIKVEQPVHVVEEPVAVAEAPVDVNDVVIAPVVGFSVTRGSSDSKSKKKRKSKKRRGSGSSSDSSDTDSSEEERRKAKKRKAKKKMKGAMSKIRMMQKFKAKKKELKKKRLSSKRLSRSVSSKTKANNWTGEEV